MIHIEEIAWKPVDWMELEAGHPVTWSSTTGGYRFLVSGRTMEPEMELQVTNPDGQVTTVAIPGTKEEVLTLVEALLFVQRSTHTYDWLGE